MNIFNSEGGLKFDHYWTVPGYRKYLEVFQVQQILDVVFSIIGLTNNSVLATFPQVFSRIAIVLYAFPFVPQTSRGGTFAVYLCLVNW